MAAQSFTPGNIVVYEVGGTSSSANATFLVEYNPAGIAVQTIPLPTTTTGTQDELTDSGAATNSGEITEAATGAILAAGYDQSTTATGSVTSSTVPRVVGVVSASGSIDTGTSTTSFSGTRFTSAATADGTNIYVAGGTGVGYTTLHSTAAVTMLTSNTAAPANQVAIVGGQLYYSTSGGGGTAAGIYALGSGLPTMGNQTSTQIVTSTKPVGFAFATVGGGTTPNVLYVADNTNGIEKFTLNANGAFVANGTVALAGVTGVSVAVSGNNATLYVTTTTSIQSLTDSSGPTGTLTGTPMPFATAPSGTVFKGDVVYQAASVCFTTGTRIRTPHGDVAIECLEAGDLVVTASGAQKPIRWIGCRHLDGRGHSLPHDQQPIRIRAGAFGHDAGGAAMPSRSLDLSPGHPLLVGADADSEGGYLVPVMCLINGTTIERLSRHRVTYWHLELEVHDILLAEGLPAESYLDWGDRDFFDGATDHALANPDFVVPGLGERCRPVAVAGEVVETERRRLDQVFATTLASHCAWGEEAKAGPPALWA